MSSTPSTSTCVVIVVLEAVSAIACRIQESPAEHQNPMPAAPETCLSRPKNPAAGPPWNDLTQSASIPRSWGYPVSLPGTQQPTGPAHQRNTKASTETASRASPETWCLLADRRAGPAVPGTPRHHRSRPTARTRTGQPGPGAAPPLPDHPPAARPAPATTARIRAGVAPQAHSRMGPRSRPRRDDRP